MVVAVGSAVAGAVVVGDVVVGDVAIGPFVVGGAVVELDVEEVLSTEVGAVVLSAGTQPDTSNAAATNPTAGRITRGKAPWSRKRALHSAVATQALPPRKR